MNPYRFTVYPPLNDGHVHWWSVSVIDVATGYLIDILDESGLRWSIQESNNPPYVAMCRRALLRIQQGKPGHGS